MIEYNTECDAFFICLTFDFVVNIIFNVVLGIGIKTCQIIIHKGQKSAAQLYITRSLHILTYIYNIADFKDFIWIRLVRSFLFK